MADSIHGHDVMEMMLDAQENFTRESLKKAMAEKFGPEARFHTCSAENMTAEELIEFLAARGKFLGSETAFSTDPSKICDH